MSLEDSDDKRAYHNFVKDRIKVQNLFDKELLRKSEALGGIDKYDDRYLNQVHKLGVNLNSSGQFDHLQKLDLSQINEEAVESEVLSEAVKDMNIAGITEEQMEEAVGSFDIAKLWQIIRLQSRMLEK